MISKAKKYVAVLLLFVCVSMIFSPQTVYAAEDSSQHETVKVGFFAMDGYHVMDEEGNRSGYGYDFLRLMARYWDVDYEYVGYDKSWDDMQQMLEDGEIDMVTSPCITLDIIKGFLTNRDINFKIQREDAKIPNVLADPARLRDVLVNILSNAVKYTPDGGTITFEARCQEKGGDGYINMRYRISDTGIGMSEEFTKEVFEEFVQEDPGARTQYHGVGLGMAIVKKYVDMMGGTISVQSKKHEGTTFTVDIPLEITDKECNKSDTGFSENVNLTGVNILLAEDNELNAEIAAVQLEELGMNVERAVDGKNAVEIFRNHPKGTFDVILMDVMMPEMNGYEATKAIRAMNDRPDGKNIPIIAMTANSFAEDVQASLDAGMNAHLSKPIVIDEVIKTILRYVHN